MRITSCGTLTPKILTEEEPVGGIEPAPFKFIYHRCRARSGYDTRHNEGMRLDISFQKLRDQGLDRLCFVYGMALG